MTRVLVVLSYLKCKCAAEATQIKSVAWPTRHSRTVKNRTDVL